MAKSKAKQYTVEEIVTFLKNEHTNETIEGQLLKRQLIRQLYKQLGDPQECDFPAECDTAGRYWHKMSGYTNDIDVFTQDFMNGHNNKGTNWCIERPSPTKISIVEDYTRAGWYCTVQAYNVLCTKFVPHPRYENVWVYFYSSRDCNKYEYVIEG